MWPICVSPKHEYNGYVSVPDITLSRSKPDKRRACFDLHSLWLKPRGLAAICGLVYWRDASLHMLSSLHETSCIYDEIACRNLNCVPKL